jgi:hypothetical protein
MRSHRTESDQANASDTGVADQLRSERCRKELRDHVGVDAVVHQQAPLNPAINLG